MKSGFGSGEGDNRLCEQDRKICHRRARGVSTYLVESEGQERSEYERGSTEVGR